MISLTCFMDDGTASGNHLEYLQMTFADRYGKSQPVDKGKYCIYSTIWHSSHEPT